MPKSHTEVFELEETVDGWDSDYYHPIALEYYDRAVKNMMASLGAKPGIEILDAGCGPGVHSIRIAKNGCDVFAIDLSETMLNHARERADGAGVSEKIEFSQADLTNLNLGRQFSAAFCWGVLIHIPDASKAIEELCSTIAPGGRLALHVLSNASLDFTLEKLTRKLLRKPFPKTVSTDVGEGVYYEYNGERLWVQRFDSEKLTTALNGHGFRKIANIGAEFTEFQWRFSGLVRSALLHLNNFVYRKQLFPERACTQIFVFEKRQ